MFAMWLGAPSTQHDDVKEVDELLGEAADDVAHVVTADIGLNDGEVDIRVVEAAVGNNVGGHP